MRNKIDGNRAASRSRGRGGAVRAGWRARATAWLPAHIPIAYKFAWAITTLVVAGMALLGLTIISNQNELMLAQMDDFGQTILDQLAVSAKEPVLAGDLLALRVMTNNLAGRESILGAVVYGDNGEVLASSGVLPTVEDIVTLYGRSTKLSPSTYTFEWQLSEADGSESSEISFLRPIRFENLVAGHALVTFSQASLAQSSQEAKRVIVWATVLMAALSTLIAFVMGRRMSRPIHDLMDASKAIGEGDYRYRFTERRNDEIGYLMDGFNTMARGLLQKSQVEQVLSRFVDDSVASELLENLDQVSLGGKHVRAAVLFADIVGFTSLSEKLPPEKVGELLNTYFSLVARSSRFYNGTIDKFIGDCVMVVFGVPQEDPEHCFHAVACAVMIQSLVERLNAIREGLGEDLVEFRIGVNAGEMLAGNLGADERMQYTVVGDAVNLASRLSSIADSGEIVVSADVLDDPAVKERVLVRQYREAQLRGKAMPVTTYLVEDLASDYRAAMEVEIEALFVQKESA